MTSICGRRGKRYLILRRLSLRLAFSSGVAPRLVANTKILQSELAFPISERTSAAKADQLIVVSGRCLNAHELVLRLAVRATKLGGILRHMRGL